MRELSPEPLRNDHITVWVPASSWYCPWCVTPGGDGAFTTVDWIGVSDGPDGRCRECGAKFVLAAPYDEVPTVFEQVGTAEELLGGDA